MDFRNIRNSHTPNPSTPSEQATFGYVSPEKDVKIPVGSLAKLNREHSKKELEKNKNQYKFLDDKGTKAYEQLRKEIS